MAHHRITPVQAHPVSASVYLGIHDVRLLRDVLSSHLDRRELADPGHAIEGLAAA